MQNANVSARILGHLRAAVDSPLIKNRRFLDDEQLIRSEQLEVLEEIFNANVRDAEIKELTSHFAGLLRRDHPCHLAVWGKTGTGKTLTLTYFLNLLTQLCAAEQIPIRTVHLDLTNPGPCFRALNDLACLLEASKYYRRGISLEEIMQKIEAKLADYHGYLVLFIDEVDNVRHDKENFMAFLIRRLPQRIPAKLILVLVSNHLDWPDRLDARVKSFLKVNEIVFHPYDAVDLQRILRIRVEKALDSRSVIPGVIEKISAIASCEHGDARKAVALLARSAYMAEKGHSPLTLEIVDQAATDLETDRYLTLIQSAPPQLQLAMAAIIEAKRRSKRTIIRSIDAYNAYHELCRRFHTRPLTSRVFGDLIAELDLYSLLRSRIVSRGRYGRTREIILNLPGELVDRIYRVVLDNIQ